MRREAWNMERGERRARLRTHCPTSPPNHLRILGARQSSMKTLGVTPAQVHGQCKTQSGHFALAFPSASGKFFRHLCRAPHRVIVLPSQAHACEEHRTSPKRCACVARNSPGLLAAFLLLAVRPARPDRAHDTTLGIWFSTFPRLDAFLRPQHCLLQIANLMLRS
jgi:hypothetical protein